jgi:hypothetical protein
MALLSLVGCGGEHVEVGRYGADAARDAEVVRDAASIPAVRPYEDGGARDKLQLTLRSATMKLSSSVEVPCGASCLDVTAEATGGQPPYNFTWDDAPGTATKTLCLGQHQLHVSDTPLGSEFGSPAATAVRSVLILASTCQQTDAGADAGDIARDGGPSLSLPEGCREVALAGTCPAQAGERLQLGDTTLRAGRGVGLRVTGTARDSYTITGYGSRTVCGTLSKIGGGGGAISDGSGMFTTSMCVTPAMDGDFLFVGYGGLIPGTGADVTLEQAFLCDTCEAVNAPWPPTP